MVISVSEAQIRRPVIFDGTIRIHVTASPPAQRTCRSCASRVMSSGSVIVSARPTTSTLHPTRPSRSSPSTSNATQGQFERGVQLGAHVRRERDRARLAVVHVVDGEDLRATIDNHAEPAQGGRCQQFCAVVRMDVDEVRHRGHTPSVRHERVGARGGGPLAGRGSKGPLVPTSSRRTARRPVGSNISRSQVQVGQALVTDLYELNGATCDPAHPQKRRTAPAGVGVEHRAVVVGGEGAVPASPP